MAPPVKATLAARLVALRQRMLAAGVHAYLVPSNDAHQSEYIAPCDGRRAFISGFTGSAGYAVVTDKHAALWTDGRYYLQASQQLDFDHWTLMKQGLPDTPEKEEWLGQVLPTSARVGFDPRLVTVEQVASMRKAFGKYHCSMEPTTVNLIDEVWGAERPPRPSNPILPLPIEFTGKTHMEKLAELRKYLSDYPPKKKDTATNSSVVAAAFVITALDEIAWLFNMRGSDIVYNPVFFAYAIVTLDEAVLYVDAAQLEERGRDHLAHSNVSVRPYTALFEDLKAFKTKLAIGPFTDKTGSEKRRVVLAGASCNWAVEEALGGKDLIEIVRSPIVAAKAIKNSVELEGFRQCHIRDAVALVNFFAWLENTLIKDANTTLSEVDAADVLESYRAKQRDFVGLSFDTISSVGPNGAIIHYKPESETCAILSTNQVYLCDSGGQYRDGTTDVTRTFHFGTPRPFEKEAFTRVLRGHIALDVAVFPTGTTGYLLDVLARTPLWEAGLDYRHGTGIPNGHGVGAFLNVHEGPHGIGTRIAYNDFPLKAGMTVTNEPGFYLDNEFGIRIENVLLVKEVATANRFGDNAYLGFEHVTIVPLGKNLIDVGLLNARERAWVNDYHRECWDKLHALVDDMGKQWLAKETSPL